MLQCVSNIDKWTDLVKKCLLCHPISKNLHTSEHEHYPARVYLNGITKQKAYDLHNCVILPSTAARSQMSLLRHRFITTLKEKLCLTTYATATWCCNFTCWNATDNDMIILSSRKMHWSRENQACACAQ